MNARRTAAGAASLLILLALAAGCAAAGDSAGPLSPASRARIAAGQGQTGKTGQPFDTPLLVRVTDAEGAGVEGVRVEWRVVEGEGLLGQTSRSHTARTNARGYASATLVAGRELGPIRVRAEVPAVERALTFRAETTVALILIKAHDYVTTTGEMPVEVSVGDTVEWWHKDMLDASTRVHSVTSHASPPAGRPFDSGFLDFDETFRFVPRTTGVWEFHCRNHPDLLRASLRVTR